MRSAAKFLSLVIALTATVPTQCAFAVPTANSKAVTKKAAYHPSVHRAAHVSSGAAKGHQAQKGGLVWNSVTAGFALAKKTNKPIVVDFYTDWCGWCKVMDEQTFNNDAVKKVLASKFVLVRANAEDGADGQKLSKALEVRGFPTTVLCDPGGTPKAVMVGFVRPDKFSAQLSEFLTAKPAVAPAASE